MNRSGFIFLLVAITIALVFTWINTQWLTYSNLSFNQKDKKIDYYLSDFTLLNIQTDGTVRYQIKGQHLIHQQSSGASEIYLPFIEVKQKNISQTSLSARKAIQKQKNGPITLQSEVLVKQQNYSNNDIIQLKSSDVTYNPVKKSLSSKNAIMLTSKLGYLKGIGFTGNLEKQEIRILSHVQSEIKP